MRQPTRSFAKPARQTALLAALSLLLAGCFQPLNINLQATPVAVLSSASTPIGLPTLDPALFPSPVFTDLPTLDPLVFATETPTSEPLVFPLETPTSEPLIFPLETATETLSINIPPSITAPATNTFSFATETPTLEPLVFATDAPLVFPTLVPTETPTVAPLVLPTLVPSPTQTLIPPPVVDVQGTLFAEATNILATQTQIALSLFSPTPLTPTGTATFVMPTVGPASTATLIPAIVFPTLTFTPSATFTNTATLAYLPGVASPTLFIPTLVPTTPPAPLIGGGDPGLPTAIAQLETPANDVQATMNAQATQIIAVVTATAQANLTLTATAQGIVPPINFPTEPPLIIGGATATPTFNFGNADPITGVEYPGATGAIDGSCRYTVLKGDRMIRIALRFGTSVDAIARTNRIINPELLSPGQILIIPTCLKALQPTAAPIVRPTSDPSAPAGSTTATIHVVREDETLWQIAQRYGVKVTALAQINGIENINLIYIGQNLVIPR
jgi:LysM repeat protein